MERAPTLKPITPMQLVIATLLGLRKSHEEIAAELKITVPTVRDHLARLAARLPGDLPASMRVIAWVRGASTDVLEGRTLYFEVMRDAAVAAREMRSLEQQVAAVQARREA